MGIRMGVRSLSAKLLKETWYSILASYKMTSQVFEAGKDYFCTLHFLLYKLLLFDPLVCSVNLFNKDLVETLVKKKCSKEEFQGNSLD